MCIGTIYFGDILKDPEFHNYRYEDIHRLVENDKGNLFILDRDHTDYIIELTNNKVSVHRCACVV